MIAALAWLRTAWSFVRKHALAVVAGLAALGGIIAYLLGRRSSSQSSSETTRSADVGRAQGHVDVLDEQATTHTARADAARDQQRDLERAQDAAASAAATKAREAEHMSAADVAAGFAEEARRRRQRERGR